MLLLNVPARQSKNYYHLLKANIAKESLVFVDALFGGLDVCARISFNTEKHATYLQKEISSLVETQSVTKQGVLLLLKPFFGNGDPIPEQNFILVHLICVEDMSEESNQKSLLNFLEMHNIEKNLRFAATFSSIERIDSIQPPKEFSDDNINSTRSHCILEFKINSLDDPRDIVMRKLQLFSSIESSRTYFGVNFGKEESRGKNWLSTRFGNFIKSWAGPLLNWKRFFGA